LTGALVKSKSSISLANGSLADQKVKAVAYQKGMGHQDCDRGTDAYWSVMSRSVTALSRLGH